MLEYLGICITWKIKHEAKIICAGIIKLPLKTCQMFKAWTGVVSKLNTEQVIVFKQKRVETDSHANECSDVFT